MPDGYSVEEWKLVRKKGRRSLLFLCQNILGYKDVNKEVHGYMFGAMQKFDGGEDTGEGKLVNGKPSPGSFKELIENYRPSVPMWDLQGPRKSLILWPRGHLKTTVGTLAYTIQWILNYPNVRILLSSGTGEQVRKFLDEILGQFRHNDVFRSFYPEFVPHGKNVKDFGNQERFTVPARTVHRKEPTVSVCSVGAVVAGGHFDVIINDDVVDKENVRTPEQIANVNSHLGFLWPLLETAPDADKRERGYQRGWWSMLGTRYDFSDSYGTIIDSEAAKSPDDKSYTIQERDIIVEGDLSDLKTCKTIWPSRMPPQALKDIMDDPLQGAHIVASQYRMNPIPDKSGLVDSPEQIVWVPVAAMKKIYAYLSLHVTVDLAGMEPSTNKLADNDFTVITPHGFGHDGTLYILPIIRGRLDPFEVIGKLFDLFTIHPRIVDVKIEKEAHARVLLPFLKREMAKRQKFLPIVEIRRDNRTSKQQRIKGLQPWFRNGSIKFADNQPHKLAIINEIMRFPKYSHDDILDTLADAMQNREGGVTFEVVPMGKPEFSTSIDEKFKRAQDGDTISIPPALRAALKIWGDDQPEDYLSPVDSMTGW